ncbi:MAG: GNAT family N-acetyltransferase [Paracoccaceae bacterium]
MIRVRPYLSQDRVACFHVFRRAVHEGAAGKYDQDLRDAWAPNAAPDLTRPDKLLDQAAWVSEEDDRLTGFMSLMPDGHLDMAFVLPEVMGRGHAAALYDALLTHARAQHLPRLTVHASHYSRSFLSRRGWQVQRVEPLQMPNGAAYDRCHMALDLTESPRP